MHLLKWSEIATPSSHTSRGCTIKLSGPKDTYPGVEHLIWWSQTVRHYPVGLYPKECCFVTGILVLTILIPGPIFSLKILVPWTNFFTKNFAPPEYLVTKQHRISTKL